MPNYRWRELVLISLSVLLSLSLWFSATAVFPALITIFHFSSGFQPWLTTAVQIGFIIGSLLSSIYGWQDLYSSRLIFSVSAVLGAICNFMLIISNQPIEFFFIRFLTGLFLAGVYPTAVKMLSVRFTESRGLAIGILVGALSIGSALPHLLNGFHLVTSWKLIISATSILSLIASFIIFLCIKEDAAVSASRKVSLTHLKRVLHNKNVMLTNIGYFGHMWELYAMWTWFPVFINDTFKTVNSEFLSFAVIGLAGFTGALLGGIWSERIGKIKVTLIALGVSGVCCLLTVWVASYNFYLTLFIAIVWGVFVIMDSAQFSAAVADFSEAEYMGTAVTFQMAIGYLITIITINSLSYFVNHSGWLTGFLFLSIGPFTGFLSMLWLHRRIHDKS